MREFSIDGRPIGDDHPCFIIAEIGVNHNGDEETAHKMVDAIADAGADCVKFQTFSAAEFVNGGDEIYEYVSQGKIVRESQLEMFTRFELAWDAFEKLFAHARQRGLIPMSTPTDRQAADLLENLGVGGFKIGSDDLVYTPFLEYVGAFNKPVIISTGMAEVEDIDRALQAFASVGNQDIGILHCTSSYPTPADAINLRQIGTLRERYPDNVIGFSDHSAGTLAAAGSVIIGASIIEKHFTLDHDMPGPDQWFSMDPNQLGALVKETRAFEENLGQAEIKPTPAEIEMRRAARRSIVVDRDLPKGHVMTAEDVRFQRPGDGLMPYELDKVLGKKLTRDMCENDLIKVADVEDC